MEKQKICIIGGSLTGLVTAIALSKLNCHIDLIAPEDVKNLKSNRTIAISEDNLDFLEKLNISKSLKKDLWPCSEMKLYTENENKVFEERNSSSIAVVELQSKSKLPSLQFGLLKENDSSHGLSGSGALDGSNNHFTSFFGLSNSLELFGGKLFGSFYWGKSADAKNDFAFSNIFARAYFSYVPSALN